ncbi:MAG: ribonuclease III [Xanthomonadales bacterium]|nr:ribonuclease III [Gammaproteobacteria bacterium]NNE05381.1 ribonuclease III [Xanthomonadales bacterium]NNL94870.1 ribonuclease III [Xanthomonadales bacterium]
MLNRIPGIDYVFKDPGLLEKALTHRSFGSHNNERLEFLGDAILSLVVADRLFHLHPDVSEGDLSRLRSRVVRGDTLARLANKLRLSDHLIMGEGELKTGGFKKNSILADTLEALFGAIYLDGGFRECERVVRQACDDVIDNLPDAEELKDPKTRLQEWMQARGRPLPIYQLEKEEGAEHAKLFTVSVTLAGSREQAFASGSSRRKAEQAAASQMLETLRTAAQ